MNRLGALLAAAVLFSACLPAPFGGAAPTPAPTAPPETPTATPASPTPTQTTRCPADEPVASAAISGSLAYPSEFIPAVAVHAIRVDGRPGYHVVHTVRHQQQFHIAGVMPGVYVVLAYNAETQPPYGAGGGYTEAVRCGLHVTCTDHSLIRVTVGPAETARDVRVYDWYAPEGTFPTKPTSGEPFTAGETLRVCNPFTDGLNVRANAGVRFPVRRTLPDETNVVVRDGPIAADGYDWYEIHVAGDPLQSGWAAGFALRPEGR